MFVLSLRLFGTVRLLSLSCESFKRSHVFDFQAATYDLLHGVFFRFNREPSTKKTPFRIIGLMLHSLDGLKTQKSMKNCRSLKIGVLRLTAHQIIGLKPTNNKFRCFSKVHWPNVRILSILFI